MISIGYYFITTITMLIFGTCDPVVAEHLGPLIDLEIFGFLAFIYYFWNFRPRKIQLYKPESQSEGATMQTRAGYSCTESHLDNCQCKKDNYTI
ncbi:nonstructural protein [Munia coronavirus HKU13-3514]|uniref:Nonstructural protein n=1 Tax=Munia coronavirus HKU13 TaxID=1297661 RepID=B6VDZ4_9NIDO|nr:nonstructural protein [Munia coronavirus HKU13-3514]ACJ12069.1 nonstructural protein [Munia coronavirus HKU13-3514]